MRLDLISNWVLGRFPTVRRLAKTEVVYRTARLESIPLAVEMLERQTTYDVEFLRRLGAINTFADLGCNVGYFTVLLADISHPRPLKGLMIDANPSVIHEARWHISANSQLAGVTAVAGMVGGDLEGRDQDFYVYASNICSSRQPLAEVHPNLKGKWVRVQTPSLKVEDLWKQHVGEEGCDLLKIDVEGAEMDFLRAEPGFIDRTKFILIEWHKWSVQLPEIERFLQQRGFQLDRIFEEDANLGTCCFKRR